MVRETSIQAYNIITSNGFIAKKNQEVYVVFYNDGPLTSAEAYKKMPYRGSDQRGNIRARVHELVKMGLLKELGKRTCSVTGMTVLFYDVTSKLPLKFEKAKRFKCKYCNGKGYHETQQTRMF